MDANKELELLTAEEEALYLPKFSKDDACRLGAILNEIANEKGKPLAIEVYHNDLMVFRHLPSGTTRDNVMWLKRKYNSVALQEMSSMRFKALMGTYGFSSLKEWGMLDFTQYVLGGGGYPVVVKESGMVGIACVSGYVGTEDHEVLVEGLSRLKEEMSK
jgi:uncharacterized protein (UPF0303 family)